VTLQKETRDVIGRTVRSLRVLFEGEFGKQATGRFGIRSSPRGDASDGSKLDAWLDPVESLSLSPAEFSQHDELVAALRYLTSEGNGPGEAVARLIREAAFTAVNRLLAVRVAEAIGVLPAVLSSGRKSAGYRDIVGDLFPGLAHDEDNYWMYVQVAGDELAPAVPRLFDRRHPTSAFIPSRACVDNALELLTSDELADAWHEPETLGWGYQFFNGDDIKQMRDASSAPRTSRELAVRNQFFTPRYVVDWLVQNTLGRRLVQAGYMLDLPLLVGEIGEHEALALEDVQVLDPAVGSGHFLLGSYDLLEKAWDSTGLRPHEAASKILPCLFGVDIDPRAAQVAQAVLLLRARRSAPNADLTPPIIVTAVPLPHSRELREKTLGNLSPAARHLADQITDALDQAPLLGSLLKVEQRLAGELASHQTAPRLAVDGTETNILNELHRALDELVSASASPEQRMFTAEATDALRFLRVCQQRYDAVLMNPPFGDPIPGTKAYLKSAYGPAATDIYAAFVSRGLELLRAQGHVGAITNRTGLFLKSFSDWRQETFIPNVSCVADLGYGVLHEALVEAAAYVLSPSPASNSVLFRSLLRERDKSLLASAGGGRTWIRDRGIFEALPNGAVSYWVAPSIVRLFGSGNSIIELGDARVGLQTSDDFRFVRLLWEVPPASIGRHQRWSPFAKGGEYAPFHSDLHLVVDWENNGERIRATGRGRPQNVDAYFKPGLTWSRRTASSLAMRPLPAGSVFADKGCFLETPNNAAGLAWANSSPVRYLVELQLAAGETTSSGGAARSYEVGIINGLPYPYPTPDRLEELGDELARERAYVSRSIETSPYFFAPRRSPDGGYRNNAVETLENCALVDDLVANAFELDVEAIDAISEEMGRPVAKYSQESPVDADEVQRLFRLPIKKLVDHALKKSGGARYLAMKTHMLDRRLEILCHLFAAHPSVILESLEGASPPGATEAHAKSLVSYLVGVAFGRWDCRAWGQDADPVDPWAPLPDTPPALLLDEHGTPRSAPKEYPIELPSQPVLADDPASGWSLTARVLEAAPELGIDLEVPLRALRSSSLALYLRHDFFADHLGVYSVSRRYAPIYWQLAVPSRRWGLWLYAPSLSRESLFAIARAAREKLSSINEQVSLTRERSGANRDARERVEGLEDLGAEVEKFAVVADEVAQSGWEPDLNDGFVLNAAPLEELFLDKRWRGQVAQHRKAMQKGDYQWATVQRDYYEKSS
jgi:hypothetical protein